jgi:hypothetical protein
MATKKPHPKDVAKPDATAKRSEKRVYFKQTDFPQNSLQQAQKIAVALVDNFAGKHAPPPDVALALGISPTSSAWNPLTGSSLAYGLTEGASNADLIKITPLGRQLVAPEEDGADVAARRAAILKPRISKEFFERYNRAKFPSDTIARNVLRSMGIPDERLTNAIEVLKANGHYAGIIRSTPTGPFVSLDSPGVPAPATTEEIAEHEDAAEPSLTQSASPSIPPPVNQPGAASLSSSLFDSKKNRVFISHGKRRAIVAQIKELLTFGNFEPVISVERESTAIPVPEKVFEDMRSCGAGVVHVSAEVKFLDQEGNERTSINENVLIEIGASMALYGKKVILLVERGVILPSNLQGLYRCDFDGEQLDYDATMKLLKTFSQFR